MRCGPLWVSPAEMCEGRVHGVPIGLPASSLVALSLLIRAGGRVVSREDIQEAATGRRSKGASRAADIRIMRIRRALGVLGRYVIAVPGRGYRLDVVSLTNLH